MAKFKFLLAGFLTLVFLSSCDPSKMLPKSHAPGTIYVVNMLNNSLFFGQITREDDRYIYLTHTYLLQQTPSDPNNASSAPRFQLIKQINDPIAPEDELIINRNHLLFYQPLRADSKIVQEIARQESGVAVPPPPVQAAPPQPIDLGIQTPPRAASPEAAETAPKKLKK